MNKLKEPLFAVMVILGLLALSFHLANAQQRPPIPESSNQRYIYMRGDTVFEMRADGAEAPLLPPQEYQRHIDSLEAALFLYKPKHGRIIVEFDTLNNNMVYRPRIGQVIISNLYDDSLWVTDDFFISARKFKHEQTYIVKGVLHSWNQDSSKFEMTGDTVKAKWEFGWVTDSIKWVKDCIIFEGDKCHEHDWVYDEPYATASRVAELVYRKGSRVIVCVGGYHPSSTRSESDAPIHDEEEHCTYEDKKRERICRNCLRSEIERERWFQRYVEPPQSEFQRLKEKQRVKQ